MPVFPTPPSITSRIAQGTPLTFEEADANFGNLTASLDETIQVIQVAAYTDQDNTFDANTTQSFGKVTATETVVSFLTSSNAVFNGNVQFNNTVTLTAGDLTSNITGSVFGTASWAESASVATTASFVVTASNANTASWANNSINANTASYVLLAKSASFIPRIQNVISAGSTYASSSANIIFATPQFQIRGVAGDSAGTASLAFGVGTNPNNFITATQNLIVTASTVEMKGSTLNKLTGDTQLTGSLSISSSTEVVLMINNLPTSDPGNPGQIWNDGGTLKVSL